MPLWKMYVPKGAYLAEEMEDLGNRITDIYSGPSAMENWGFVFPRFYTSVIFHEVEKGKFLIGGEPRDQFIQIEVVHIAGGMEGDSRTPNEQAAERMGISETEVMEKFFQIAVYPTLKPYIQDRGYEWEISIENAPAHSWRIDGLIAPPADSVAHKRWTEENKTSPLP